MTDKFSGADSVDFSARVVFKITPSDDIALPVVTKGIFVGGAGNVSVLGSDPLPGGNAPIAVVFNCVQGQILPVRATMVTNANTTATNLVGLA